MIISYLLQQHMSPLLFTPLQGYTVAIKCTDLNKTWYISFEEQAHILDATSNSIDVSITSTVSGFTRYVVQKDRSAIHIAGNMEVAQLLQQTFDDLEIDWEEEISKYTGDIIAHQSMRFLHGLSGLSIDQMLQEYLQEEIKILPTKHEINDFLNDVDQMRNRVEKLQRRIEQYANNN